MRETRAVNTEWIMFFPHLSLKVAAECTIRPGAPVKKAIKVQPRPNSHSVPGLRHHHCWVCNAFSPVLLLSVLWLYCCLCCSKHLTVVPRPSPHLPLPWAGCWQVDVCVFIHTRAYLQAYPASFTMHFSSGYYRMRCEVLQQMCWRTSTAVGAGRDCQKEWYHTRAHQWIVKDRLTQPKYNLHVLENITMPFKASGFMLWTTSTDATSEGIKQSTRRANCDCKGKMKSHSTIWDTQTR